MNCKNPGIKLSFRQGNNARNGITVCLMYNPKKKKQKGKKEEDPAFIITVTNQSPAMPTYPSTNATILLSFPLSRTKPVSCNLSPFHPITHPLSIPTIPLPTVYQISSSLLTISTVGVFGSNLFILFRSALVTKDGVIGTTGLNG